MKNPTAAWLAFQAHNELARALNLPFLQAQKFARAQAQQPSERLSVGPAGLLRRNEGTGRYFRVVGLHTHDEQPYIHFTTEMLPL